MSKKEIVLLIIVTALMLGAFTVGRYSALNEIGMLACMEQDYYTGRISIMDEGYHLKCWNEVEKHTLRILPSS